MRNNKKTVVDAAYPPGITHTAERNVKLDFLRVLAILECIVSHALMAEPMSQIDLLWIIIFLPDTGAVFFMASGAIILNRSDKARGWRYVWHRISSYLPEFIFFSALYVFLDHCYGFTPEGYTVTQRLCYMFVTPTWGPGWFILALTGLYLVLPLLTAWIQVATRRQIEIAIAIWLSSTILPVIMPHTEVHIAQSPFGTVFNYAGYMLVGYWLVRWPFARRSVLFKTMYFAVTVAVGIIFGYFLGRSGAKWGYMLDVTTGLSINIAMISFIQFGIVLLLPDRWFTGLFAKLTVNLSILSLGVYCCHWLVIRYWAIPNETGWVTGTLVTLAVSIPVAWLMRRARLMLK